MPFAQLARWYIAELDVPFWDRRVEALAYLTCAVIRGIAVCQMEPKPEMFHLTPEPEPDSAPEPDFPQVDQDSIDRFAARMASMG